MEKGPKMSARLISFGGPVLVLSALALLSACVSVTVEPLTSEHYPAHADRVELLETEPARPHIRLARIIATSQSAGEASLTSHILSRARQIGADAVVRGKSDVLESMGPGPLYQSTLSPAGTAGYSPFGWGWWNPFYLDPWSYVQGASDQPVWTEYLSGLAIRYRPDPGVSTRPQGNSQP